MNRQWFLLRFWRREYFFEMIAGRCIQACGATWLSSVLLDSQSRAIQSHQGFSITIKKAVSGPCGVAVTRRLLKAVVMTPRMTELWWNPAAAATQSVSHPSSLISLYALSCSGFYSVHIYSAFWDCFIFPHSVQLLGGTYCVATKLKIKPGYWITACIIHQTLQFRESSVGSDWKKRQNLNTNKMFPRGASWIGRHITHNTAHNLFKHLHLLISIREKLHQTLLKS